MAGKSEIRVLFSFFGTGMKTKIRLSASVLSGCVSEINIPNNTDSTQHRFKLNQILYFVEMTSLPNFEILPTDQEKIKLFSNEVSTY